MLYCDDSNRVIQSSRRCRSRANVLGWQRHASSNDVVGSLIEDISTMYIAVTVNESVAVDVVGGEGVAVTVGVSFAVKNFIIVVSLGTFGFGGGGIAWTIICNVYS